MRKLSTGMVLILSAGAVSAEWNGDWIQGWRDLGKIYENHEHPYLQELTFSGRVHYQYGYSDGESFDRGFTREFNGGGEELRRLRFGVEATFLKNFELEAGVRLSQGDFRNPSVGYDEMDSLTLGYNFNDLYGFEDVKLSYGRMKFAVGGEWHRSSNRLKTVERSQLSNTFGFSRATGGLLEFSRWETDFRLGVLTTDIDEVWGQWNGRTAYYASAAIDLGNRKDLTIDVLYADADPRVELIGGEEVEQDIFQYEWVTSVTYEQGVGAWDFFANATYGDTGDGKTYGFIIMPSYEIIEDKLEAVARFQWARSSNESFNLNRRNLRNAAELETPAVDLNGNQNLWQKHRSVYLGLNYDVIDKGARVMIGAEYEQADRTGAELEGYTYWGAVRLFF